LILILRIVAFEIRIAFSTSTRLSLRQTIDAAWTVISAAAEIATPMSAYERTNESFTPSPTNITISPFA
jgi:hypothetical protein